MLPGFLNVLIPSQNRYVCKTFTDKDHFPNKTSKLYNVLVNKYGELSNGAKILTEEGIGEILMSINSSIGEALSNKKVC